MRLEAGQGTRGEWGGVVKVEFWYAAHERGGGKRILIGMFKRSPLVLTGTSRRSLYCGSI